MAKTRGSGASTRRIKERDESQSARPDPVLNLVPKMPTQPPTPATGGGGVGREDVVQSDLLPEPEQRPSPAATPFFSMFIDPSRSDSGPGVRLPDTPLPGTRGLLTNLLSGGTVNPGDVLPNLQEALKPIFRPGETVTTEEERKAAWQRVQEEATETVDPNRQLFANLNTALLSGSTVGRAVAGVPEAVINTFSIPGRAAERVIGTAEQAVGIDINPAQAITGRVLPRLLARAAQAIGMEQEADALARTEGMPPSLTATLVANFVARARLDGKDPQALEDLLGVLAPEQDRDEMITQQTELVQASRGGVTRSMFDAAEFTYEGMNYALEARQRLSAGEPREDVMADIARRTSQDPEAMVREIAGQLVLDPLNALDFVRLPGTRIGGGTAARVDDWAEAGRTTHLLPAQNADEVVRGMREVGQQRGLFARTPTTIVRQGMAEASDHVSTIIAALPDDALRLVEDAGITRMTPQEVAMDLLLNPVNDDVLGSGKSADEMAQLLGLRQNEALARQWGLPAGTTDLLNSPAAVRTREVLRVMSDDAYALPRQWQGVEEAWRAVGKADAGMLNAAERSAVLETAENALVDFMRTMEDATKAAYNITDETNILSRLAKWPNKLQGTMATYFHMGWSPGWAIRNFTNNQVTLLIDQIDVLTPLRRVTDDVAEYEMLNSGLAREFGGGGAGRAMRDVPEAVRGALRLPGGKQINPLGYTMSRRAERSAGLRAIREGFTRVLSPNWRLGKNIPVEAFSELSRRLGDPELAQWVLAHTERAWTNGMLDDLPRLLQELDPARTISDPDLLHDLRRANIDDEVLRLLRETEPENRAQAIEEYLQRWDAHARAAVDNAANPVGSVESILQDDADLLDEVYQQVESMPLDARRVMRSQRERSIQLTREVRSEVQAYAEQVLNRMRQANLDGQIANQDNYTRLLEEANILTNREQRAWQTWRGDRDRLLSGLFERNNENWRYMPEFASVTSKDQAWDIYFRITDEGAVGITRQVYDQYMQTIQQMTDLIPDATFGPLPDWDKIAREMRLPSDAQRRWLTALQREAHQRGIDNLYHLTNYLKKEGVLDEGIVFMSGSDIPSEGWVDEALAAIGRREPQARAAAVTTTDTMQEILEGGQRAIAPGAGETPYWGVDSRIAQRQEVETLLARVVEHVAGAPKAGRTVDADQLQAVREWVDLLRPRLTETRRIGQEVGQQMRDFALLNYNDRRNFDTLLGLGFSYPYWYTRTMKNFVQRAYQQPGAVAALIKMQQFLRRLNDEKPEWWQDQLSLNIMGNQFYVPIMGILNPLNGFLSDKFRDPDQRATEVAGLPVGAIASEMGQFGPGIHSWIQFALAGAAHLQGNREQSLSWMSYLGQPTKAAHAVTVLARQYLGADFIPPGGMALEPWLGENTENGRRWAGSKWDVRRMGLAMQQLVDAGEISEEQAIDAMYRQGGDVWDMALQRNAANNSLSVLASYLFGAGVRVRPETEIELAMFDLQRRALMAQTDEMSPETRRQAWRALREEYPWADMVLIGRMDTEERDEALTWSVFDRLPPNNRSYFEAVGWSEDDLALLDQFYDGGLDEMPPRARERFMSGIYQMAAMLELPEDATRYEWYAAQDARNAMWLTLSREFGGDGQPTDMWALESTYFQIEDPAERRAFIEQYPVLPSYWERKNEVVSANPLLSKYYGSMETFERLLRNDFEAQWRARYPDYDATANEYYMWRDTDPEKAREFYAAHPELGGYYDELNLWTIGLREQLESMADPILTMETHWATLRDDAEPQTEGERSLTELIAAGSRPMGDFDLPEDLGLRELQSTLNLEVSTLPYTELNRLRRDLRVMGGLDDTLDAFLEWGRGSGDLSAVAANETELRALLAAVSDYRIAQGYVLGQRPQVASGGGGGGGYARTRAPRRSGGGGRIRSPHGGASQQPQTEQQAAQLSAAIDQTMQTVQNISPTFWSMLRTLSGMTPDQATAFWADPANSHFLTWLGTTLKGYLDPQGITLNQVLDWFKQGRVVKPPKSNKKNTSSTRATYYRQSA